MEAMREVCKNFPLEDLVVADLGCSSGPNALSVMSEIIDAINEHYRRSGGARLPEVQVFLNDLPCNDFNCIFQLLSQFKKKHGEEKGDGFASFYAAGLPGSFYERLFPPKRVHFFHSSCSQMWLSQVPRGLEDEEVAELNKENIYIPIKYSNPIVVNLYLKQFQRDFSTFLKLRSEELINGGKMVLTILGGNTSSFLFGIVSEILKSMVSEGLVEEERLKSFNIPHYMPSKEEIESIIEAEGSFMVESEHICKTNLVYLDDPTISRASNGEIVAKILRSLIESLFISHFGEEIIEDFVSRLAKSLSEIISKENTMAESHTFVLNLKNEQ